MHRLVISLAHMYWDIPKKLHMSLDVKELTHYSSIHF